MNSFGKTCFTLLLVAACIAGGVRHFLKKEPTQTTVADAPAVTNQPPSLAVSKETGSTSTPAPAPNSEPTTTTQPPTPPLNARAAIQRIYDLMASKNLNQSLELANSLVTQLEPFARTQSDDLGFAYLSRGEVYEDLDRNDDAITDFEHLYYLWRDDTPDSGRAWLRAYDALTRAYARASRWGDTLAMVERGLKAVANTHPGDFGYEVRLHERKINALLALDRKTDAEKAIDTFRQRIPDLLKNDSGRRVRWLGWIGECYGKLGLNEKRRTALAESASNLPSFGKTPTTPEEFSDALSMAKAALAAGNAAEAKQRADVLRNAICALQQPDEFAKASIGLCRLYADADMYKDGLSLIQETATLYAKSNQPAPEIQRQILRWTHTFLNDLCLFEEAAKATEAILDFDQKSFGENSEQYIRDLKTKAHDLFFTSNSKDALNCARDALARAERLEPANDALLESCLGEVGFIITQSNEAPATEAETALRRAIEINEKRNGKLHPSSADDRINLGTALMDQHRLYDAKASLDNAFACLKAANALNSDLAGWGYCQLSSLYEMQKEWILALEAARRSVEIRERIYGLQNFRTRIMLRQFVSVAWQAGAKQECITRAEQLLNSERTDHGWANYRDIILCAKLAGWHIDQGNNKRADELAAILKIALQEYYTGSM